MTTRQRGVPIPDEEIRYWASQLETRSSGTVRRIGGLGVPFEKRSRLLPGGFYEEVDPKAVAKTLADGTNIVSRLEHHPEWLLGSTDAGTMRVRNESRGVDYEVDLPDTSAGRDTYELHKRGDLRYASMGFNCFNDEFRREGSSLIRRLMSIRLYEISPTAQPAYWDTASALRSLADQVGEDPADVEALAAQGELRSLFPDRSPVVIDVAPTPLTVAQRSAEPVESRSDDLDIRRRKSELMGRKMDWQTAPKTIEQRLLGLRVRKSQWDAVESRSLDVYAVNSGPAGRP